MAGPRFFCTAWTDFTSPPSMRGAEPVIQRASGDTRNADGQGYLNWLEEAVAELEPINRLLARDEIFSQILPGPA